MPNRIAVYISAIFEPFSVSFLSLLLIMGNLNLSREDKIFWFTIAIFFVGIPPLAVLIYEKRTGKIKDWFISNRLERRNVHLAWAAGSLLLTLFAYYLAAPDLLLALSLTLLVLSLVVTFTTFYWKISIHMVGVSLFVLILLLTYSPSFLWAALLIPLVAWARIQLKAHTLTQVLAGTWVTMAVTYLVFSYFGLASF